ncbi:MAG: hypothetical protein WBN75_19790 [Verrucomicrobiia bacterium]
MAIRGPRDVKAEVSAGTGTSFWGMAGAGGGVAVAGTTGAVFDELTRLADDLRGRLSFK